MSIYQDALSLILARLRLTAGIFTEASYCGTWGVDTSGQHACTFHLIQSGDCWLSLDGAPSRRLQPGDFVLFPRDARHLISSEADLPADVPRNVAPPAVKGAPTTDMLCGFFEFESSSAWPLLDSLPEVLVLDLAADPVGDSRALLNLLISEAAANRPGRTAVINQLAYVLFVHTLRVHLADDLTSGLMAAFADPRIGQALNGFHAAPGERWSVARLAEAAGMSRASFSAGFRDLTGRTPMSYVADWRMQVAVDLLATTSRSVAAISVTVGYESEAAFRNAFRRLLGYPPGEVRRQPQDQPSGPKVSA